VDAAGDLRIIVSIADQRLRLLDSDRVVREFAVSTARNGPGERMGSECTPRGRHVVRAKIGGGAPLGSIFVARRATGECYHPQLRAKYPERDWILTRILWLSGLEPGRNRLGNVDTMRRFIYIHGCPDDTVLGVPGSHGCIRMRNSDVVELYDRVPVGTPVLLE
jgi:lipoprotein-anchoring transpeptidase ErfK/SrfK